MKECLREMKKCWEEVMREEEIEEQLEDDYNELEGVEGDKELSKVCILYILDSKKKYSFNFYEFVVSIFDGNVDIYDVG